MFTLVDFVRESNRIEGIVRAPFGSDATIEEIEAHEKILGLHTIAVEDMEDFVRVIQPGVPQEYGSPLRIYSGMDVRVGSHFPPPGGPEVNRRFRDLLNWANMVHFPWMDAYDLHLQYETLHPFMDGNGRSGRVLWLWMRGGIEKAPLGFLHQFYYDTLSALPR